MGDRPVAGGLEPSAMVDGRRCDLAAIIQGGEARAGPGFHAADKLLAVIGDDSGAMPRAVDRYLEGGLVDQVAPMAFCS